MPARTLSIVLAALFALPSCDERDVHAREMRDALHDAGEDLDRAADAFNSYAYARRQELRTEMQRRIDDLEDDFARYRTRARELSGEARARAEATAARLDQELAGTRQHLQRLETATEEAWHEARDAAVEIWRALRRSVEEAKGERR